MTEHSITKLRQLLESDARERSLERRWKQTDSPEDLFKYLKELIRNKPNGSHEIEREGGYRHMWLDRIAHNGVIHWQTTKPSYNFSGGISSNGTDTDDDRGLKTAIKQFYESLCESDARFSRLLKKVNNKYSGTAEDLAALFAMAQRAGKSLIWLQGLPPHIIITGVLHKLPDKVRWLDIGSNYKSNAGQPYSNELIFSTDGRNRAGDMFTYREIVMDRYFTGFDVVDEMPEDD